MNLPNYHENLKVVAKNKMPRRSAYIPYFSKEATQPYEKNSDRAILLNGEWKYKYYKSYTLVPEALLSGAENDNELSNIIVPSVWQQFDIEKHHYSNVEYVIPFDPPYVPHDNPCVLYVKEYECEDVSLQQSLCFEGVDSCFYVWINGNFLGYHQSSHAFAEFDVTHYIKKGLNRIAVLNLKWCDGTYLECQDKFRMSGIFRDVYLLRRPENRIHDFTIVTTHDNKKSATIKVDITSTIGHDIPIEYTLYDESGETVSGGVFKGNTVTAKIDEVHYWDAENPYVYELLLTCENEKISQLVCMREVSIIDGVFCVNRKAIKLHGTNRHDMDPVKGAAVTAEDLLQDILLMKRHHLNAVRTSHYPNAPALYTLCDQYGLYVIDEADIEAHGIISLYGARESGSNGTVADNDDFLLAIENRVLDLYFRDKNHGSVIMWSLGNESGSGKNMSKAAALLHRLDKTRPVNYESSTHPVMCEDISGVDVMGRMYLPLNELQNILENPMHTRPLYLSEYIHCMGNSPGDIEEYWQFIEEHEQMFGAFIWEWCDQSIDAGVINGKTKFLYGGDFKEFPHCGNFCVDGIVYPDRRVHTGLLEYKNVHRPVRVYSLNDELTQFMVHNYMHFTNFVNYGRLIYEIMQNGKIINTGKIEKLSIEPQGEAGFNLALPTINGSFSLRIISIKHNSDKVFSHEEQLGFDQFFFEGNEQQPQQNIKSGSVASREDDSGNVIAETESLVVKISKTSGLPCSIIYKGEELLRAPMEYNIFRAPTDNDRFIKLKWLEAGFNRVFPRVYDLQVINNGSSVCITSIAGLTAVYLQRIMTIECKVVIHSDATILVNMKATKAKEMPTLPRFGIRTQLADDCEVQYLGYGPHESYCDKHRASYHGRFSSALKDLHEDYIRPQENGSHWGCNEVKLIYPHHTIEVASHTPFCFNASQYTQEQLVQAAHSFELEPCGNTVLCVDYKQNGIGSNSCGPELLPQYRFDETEFEFEFWLKIIKNI